MKRLYLPVVIIIMIAAIHGLSAQTLAPRGKVQVIAVKGNVMFKGSVLKKSDLFEFNSDNIVMNQLDFSGSTDWVKVKEINSGKTYSYYKQKKYACSNCLGTRGNESESEVMKALSGYFGRKTIFLFETDTLILIRTSRLEAKFLPIFQISINGKVYNRIVGDHDTLFVSRDRLYGFAKDENILWPSFQADSIRIVFSDKRNQKETIPQLPAFNVIFFEDAVSYLGSMELSPKEICEELTENYIKLQTIMNLYKLNDSIEAEQWLLSEINEQRNNFFPSK